MLYRKHVGTGPRITDSTTSVHPTFTTDPRNPSMTMDLEQADGITLAHRHNEPVIAPRHFVRHSGASQASILSKGDLDHDEELPTRLGHSPCFTWRESFDLNGFRDIELWKHALLEAFATSMLVWITSLVGYAVSLRITAFASGPVIPSLLISITNNITLTLFIYGSGPISGGHMNPLITIGTFFGRLVTFPRTILYIVFQILGATITAFLMRAALDQPSIQDAVPGCSIDPSLTTAAQAYVLETMTCFSFIYLAFATGLDPQKKSIYGPVVSPALMGLSLGLCSFATGAVKQGYTGAAINAARCFGLMAAEGRWDFHWVHWMGAITAGAVNGLLYWAIPLRQNI